jgi:hypothetical protein
MGAKTASSKSPLDGDMDWIDGLLTNKNHKNKKNQEKQPQDHQEPFMADFHVPLRESVSRCCDRALSILADDPTNAYKRELLLDNLKIMEQEVHSAAFISDYDGDDLLSHGDLEEDLEDWDNEQQDADEMDYSTCVVDYHQPLSNESASPSYRRERNVYRRELLLDGCFEDMNRALGQLQTNELEDDLLSQGDLESFCDDIEDEYEYDDDEEDRDDDSFSSLSGYLSETQRILSE